MSWLYPLILLENLIVELTQASTQQLQQWHSELQDEYEQFKKRNLKLNLTRGKPSPVQLDLSSHLDGILEGNYLSKDGTDTRNYGGLEGIAEARELGAALLGVKPGEVIAGGSSSLQFMHQAIFFAYLFGPDGKDSAWQKEGDIKFICPVPGYDRHFRICQDLGIKMINVDMTSDGPDMDQVEDLIKADSSIKGLWCIPKYSNPTGVVYSDAVVERIAKLGQIAPGNFRVFWDNAYAVHDFSENPPGLANIMDYCRQHGTEHSVLQFASTSKMSFAGAGLAFFAASEANLAMFIKYLGTSSVGPDKVNQLRHIRLFPDMNSLMKHMRKHADILRPRFDCVLDNLSKAFADNKLGKWETPQGGYFVSFDTLPGLAKKVVRLAGDAGVELTPAGAPFPYGKDPDDSNIRLSPSFPSIEDIDIAMKIFVTCVKIASVEQQLDKVTG